MFLDLHCGQGKRLSLSLMPAALRISLRLSLSHVWFTSAAAAFLSASCLCLKSSEASSSYGRRTRPEKSVDREYTFCARSTLFPTANMILRNDAE